MASTSSNCNMCSILYGHSMYYSSASSYGEYGTDGEMDAADGEINNADGEIKSTDGEISAADGEINGGIKIRKPESHEHWT